MSQRSSFPSVIVMSALTTAVIVVSLWVVGIVSAGPGLLPLLQGGAPTVINYQGRLTDPTTGQAKTDGSYDMVFRIYSAESGGSPLWTGSHTTPNGNPVAVAGGLLSVLLGSGTGNSLSANLFSSTDRWIEVQVASEILSPRQRIGSVPYALQAEEARNAATLGGQAPSAFVGQGQGSSITSAMFMAGAVSSNSLADNAVTSTKIAEGTIVNADVSAAAAISPTKLVFYGDGSGGVLNVTTNSELSGNSNFTECTIQSGITFNVPAGATIRCAGSFRNNGTIIVANGAPSGRIDNVLSPNQVLPRSLVAGTGDTKGPAGLPEIGTAAIAVDGGAGGSALPSLIGSGGLQQLRVGGGGGVTIFGGDPEPSGGGLVRILARGPVVNASLIKANGTDMAALQDPGAGGGGGGVVVLASSTAVTNTGQIRAQGGIGGDSTEVTGPGGGGGGGLIALVAPLVDNQGQAIVEEGLAGAVVGTVTQDPRRGGGGGGGSAGPGGAGGGVPAGNPATPAPALKGEAGLLVILRADPATMWP